MAGDRRGTRIELPHRRLIIVMGLLSAVSSIGGSIELLVWQTGSQHLPLALIEHTPFSSFLVPALLLGWVVGGTSLASAVLALRRSRFAADATLLAGGALTVWIVAEAAMMRSVQWLHIVYGGLGVAIIGLGLSVAWRTRALRHRWIIVVTAAETVGFLAPACAGILATSADLADAARAALLVAAGMLEGAMLGAGQASVLPWPARRARYTLLTALGAGIVWSSVMLMIAMIKTKSVPGAVLLLAGLVTAVVGLGSIGAAQWLELRHHTQAAYRWIAWTALAWAIALPFSFFPGPFVDESTPFAPQLVLWGCGGLLMAYAMAAVTWQGVGRLLGTTRSHRQRTP